MSDSKLSRPEIYRLVNEYIGVSGGYLGDFSYRTHEEFYPQHCDLDIDMDALKGTTRERFLHILSSADGSTQAKIVRGILAKYPVAGFPDDSQAEKQCLFDEFILIATRLEKQSGFGVRGAVKNIIFAADGPKPRIVLRDATTNEIEIVENAQYCLVYDREIPDLGLSWGEIVTWWRELQSVGPDQSDKEVARSLYRRLLAGQNEPERFLFDTYYAHADQKFGFEAPALIPQVYLHYDPYTLAELQENTVLERQRMDFLMLLPQRVCVVIEVDGKQHYSLGSTSSPKLYSKMVAEDRSLRLKGYEMFRFGGFEFLDKKAMTKTLHTFFDALFKRYEFTGA